MVEYEYPIPVQKNVKPVPCALITGSHLCHLHRRINGELGYCRFPYVRENGVSKKKDRGSMALWINSFWSGWSEVIYTNSLKGTDHLVTQYHCKVSLHWNTITANLYITHSAHNTATFWIPFYRLLPHFLKEATYYYNWFQSTTDCIWPDKLLWISSKGRKSVLNRFITKCTELFPLKLHVPISNCEYCLSITLIFYFLY